MAKQCKSIIISDCPDNTTCESCAEIIKTHCIKYTGEDLVFLGIEKGDNLNAILTKLNTILENAL